MPSLTHHHKKRMRDDSNDDDHRHHHIDEALLMPLYDESYNHYKTTSNLPADYLLRRSDELHATLNAHHDDKYFQHGGNCGLLGPRKIVPLPRAKKLRMTEWQGPEEIPSIHQQYDQAAAEPRQRSPRHNSRSPLALIKELQQTSGNSRPSSTLSRTTTTSAALLSPCHICHRKPTKKSDLDSYADCEGCGERTCYVCIRECTGWKTGQDATTDDEEVLKDRPPTTAEEENLSASFHMEDAPGEDMHTQDKTDQERKPNTESWGQAGGGHRNMVCSRCCVERGPEGEVICLGCLEK